MPRKQRKRPQRPKPRPATRKALMRLTRKPRPTDDEPRRSVTQLVTDTEIGRELTDPEAPQQRREAALRAEAAELIRLEELKAELRAERATPERRADRPRTGRPPGISDAEFLRHWDDHRPSATWAGTDPERARLLGISRYQVRRTRERLKLPPAVRKAK